MPRYSVVVTPFAAANIQGNPVYADRWLAAIREKILSLDTLPESHAVARESAAFDVEIRQVLVGRGTPWKVFFTVQGSAVHVLHVRHGGRDLWQP